MSIKLIQNILNYVVSIGLLLFLGFNAIEYTTAILDEATMAAIGPVGFSFYLQIYLPGIMYFIIFCYSVYLYHRTKDSQYFALAPMVWLLYLGLLVAREYFTVFA